MKPWWKSVKLWIAVLSGLASLVLQVLAAAGISVDVLGQVDQLVQAVLSVIALVLGLWWGADTVRNLRAQIK